MTDKTVRKRKKPNFVVKEAHFSARVKWRWRFPRGRHSAVRQYHKGRPALPTVGYGSPKEERGKVKGLQVKVVKNLRELKLANPGTEKIMVSGTVGKRKKLELLQFAQKNNLQIGNVKEIEESIKAILNQVAGRKLARQEKLKQKDKKQKEKEEKRKEKEAKKEAEKKKEVGTEGNFPEEGSQGAEERKQKEEQAREIIEKTLTKKQ